MCEGFLGCAITPGIAIERAFQRHSNDSEADMVISAKPCGLVPTNPTTVTVVAALVIVVVCIIQVDARSEAVPIAVTTSIPAMADSVPAVVPCRMPATEMAAAAAAKTAMTASARVTTAVATATAPRICGWHHDGERQNGGESRSRAYISFHLFLDWLAPSFFRGGDDLSMSSMLSQREAMAMVAVAKVDVIGLFAL